MREANALCAAQSIALIRFARVYIHEDKYPGHHLLQREFSDRLRHSVAHGGDIDHASEDFGTGRQVLLAAQLQVQCFCGEVVRWTRLSLSLLLF
jgi:hypothetical protein